MRSQSRGASSRRSSARRRRPSTSSTSAQRSGKRVVAFAGESDFDADTIRSNTFTMEWPRGSGSLQEFPEIDRAAWVSTGQARRKLVAGQAELVDRLVAIHAAGGGPRN